MLPKIKNILYATDLGPGAPQVFRYALSLAQQYDARIIIVKAVEPLSTFGQSLVELHVTHAASEQLHRDARKQVRATIVQRLHDFCAAELSRADEVEQRVSDIRVVDGQPCEVILEQARQIDADLIVLGSHRHSVFGEALLGTTTQKVLHRSERPVLVVRISTAEGSTDA
ncbi:MAG: universal stress protein [Desulfuromonadales bacterium]|nr:universal stress protein [Desulfuromonadales bacterium]MDT8424156.1 universal stress protein [Desulfuromonadales bacterium]